MHLAHLHVPRLITYNHSLQLQSILLERHFRYKALLRSARPRENGPCLDADRDRDGEEKRKNVTHASANGHQLPSTATDGQILSGEPPAPAVVTFSTYPTYTVGRRQLHNHPISSDQQSFLTSSGLATFQASSRGGLLTYHGPGQLTAYVIADLRRYGISARCWVRLLEEAVMRTCSAWGVRTTTTEDPGVWISPSPGDLHGPGPADGEHSERKICAIGVQVSRGITSHGIGLNVHDAALPLSLGNAPPRYEFVPAQTHSASYDPATRGYLSWGFSRIVACGLEGKGVTWLSREANTAVAPLRDDIVPNEDEQSLRSPTTCLDAPPLGNSSMASLETVAGIFAQQVVQGLNNRKAPGKESTGLVVSIKESDLLSAPSP